MEMDLAEIAELTGVDTCKCLDFRASSTGLSEGPARTGTPSARLPTPQAPSCPLQTGGLRLCRKTFKYPGEKMEWGMNHLVSAPSPPYPPLHVSLPHLLLFDLPLCLFTFTAVYGVLKLSLKCPPHPGVTALERGGVP